jgi:hypothetical protein
VHQPLGKSSSSKPSLPVLDFAPVLAYGLSRMARQSTSRGMGPVLTSLHLIATMGDGYITRLSKDVESGSSPFSNSQNHCSNSCLSCSSGQDPY